jgi:hypothetical protein
MKFIIFKVDCNHDIWILESRKCYLYPTCWLGLRGGSLLFFLGNPNKGDPILLLFWGPIERVMSKRIRGGDRVLFQFFHAAKVGIILKMI